MMRRSGFTLVETVGFVVATGMLLTLSALLLNKAFDAHRVSLSHLQRMRSLQLFVDRWRDDVQSSTQVTPGAELLIKKTDNFDIVYSIVNQSMVRTRRQDGKDIGHDHWQLPSQCSVTWHINDQGRFRLLIGKLEFNGDPIAYDDLALVSRIGTGESK